MWSECAYRTAKNKKTERSRKMAKKKTIIELRKMVAAGEKIVYLTGYDYLTA